MQMENKLISADVRESLKLRIYGLKSSKIHKAMEISTFIDVLYVINNFHTLYKELIWIFSRKNTGVENKNYLLSSIVKRI